MNLIEQIVDLALFEDSGLGDITTESILNNASGQGIGRIKTKQDIVLAGLKVVEVIFRRLDPLSLCRSNFIDGDKVMKGSECFEVKGELTALFKGERIALNFLQRLSGIATHTRNYVETLLNANPHCLVRLTDTRKTTPGWRILEKDAVRSGGAYNHRFSLFDGILIKDNHIAIAGSIEKAVWAVRQRCSHLMKIEVEVSDMAGIQQALSAGVDIIMLDNMSPEAMIEAVNFIGGRAIIEASGNVSLKILKTIADTGVDIISCGALTHQAKSVDMNMSIERCD